MCIRDRCSSLRRRPSPGRQNREAVSPISAHSAPVLLNMISVSYTHLVIVLEDLAYFAMDFRQDLSKPFQAPYQPSVAHYTDYYCLLYTSRTTSSRTRTRQKGIEGSSLP